MPGFVRVYDPKAKTVQSWPADASLTNDEGEEVLIVIEGADATDVYGQQLPPEFNVSRKPTAKQTAAKAADPKPEEGQK